MLNQLLFPFLQYTTRKDLLSVFTAKCYLFFFVFIKRAFLNTLCNCICIKCVMTKKSP